MSNTHEHKYLGQSIKRHRAAAWGAGRAPRMLAAPSPRVPFRERASLLHGVQRWGAQHLRWANDIAYVDNDKREHCLCVFGSRETKPGKNGQDQTTTFRCAGSVAATPERFQG